MKKKTKSVEFHGPSSEADGGSLNFEVSEHVKIHTVITQKLFVRRLQKYTFLKKVFVLAF